MEPNPSNRGVISNNFSGIGPVTSEMIAKRAFEIWAGGSGGSETENWARAERELMSGK